MGKSSAPQAGIEVNQLLSLFGFMLYTIFIGAGLRTRDPLLSHTLVSSKHIVIRLEYVASSKVSLQW